MKKIKTYLLIPFLALYFAGCTGSFETINTDPDGAINEEVPVTNNLAFVIRYASENLFDDWFDLNESCGFGGHISKMQYTSEGYYQFRTSVNSNSWYYIYLTLSNIDNVITKAQAAENSNMENVGKVLKAQIFQIATDRWRDIPFTEAGKITEGILKPQYDKQEDIYPALLTMLKEAADGFADDNSGELGDGDIMYDDDIKKAEGEIVLWQRYCNSLRLRLAMRISSVDATLAKSTVEEILGDPTRYPVIETNDQNAFFNWPSGAYQEPWAAYYLTRPSEFGVSDVMINQLKNTSDPRLSVYAVPATATGEYNGYGIGNTVSAVVSQYSRIGERFMNRDGASGFTPYFRSAETYFDIAEAALLGWNTGGITAETAYTKAVTLSLEENSVAQADITTYLAGAGKYNGTKNQVYLQLWIALFKQGMEAWSTYRRTGVPALYIAPGSVYPNHNVPPMRYAYPQTELDLNTANVTPYAAEIVDNFWGKQMWWDTRTDVY